MGSVEPLKKLHVRWGDEVRFVDVLIRQAHPGPGARPYRDLDAKMRDARMYRGESGLPWPVLVDDLEGTVHQAYGGLADPTYLIGTDGRVSFYGMWTHAPTLHEAIGALLARGGRGIVRGGVDHVPHMLPSMTDGWRGIRRGLPQSFTDLLVAGGPMPVGIWLGYRMRPLLAPLALRAAPLPTAAKAALAVGALAVGMGVLRWRRGG